jgi:hypothetical protein
MVLVSGTKLNRVLQNYEICKHQNMQVYSQYHKCISPMVNRMHQRTKMSGVDNSDITLKRTTINQEPTTMDTVDSSKPPDTTEI